MKKWIWSGLLALSLICTLAAGTGCEDKKYVKKGEKSGENTENSGLVGTWSLSGPENVVFAHFAADGTWKITDDQAASSVRVYGTYNVDGDVFTGTMTNPGVGEGEIAGTFSGSSLSMDFVESWNSPVKHVPYTGSKM